jgi:hypothetical protein
MYYGLYVKTVLLFIYSAWRCQTIIIDRKRIMSSKVIFLVVVGLLAVVALGSLDSQYVPVSRRFPGLVIGNDNSAVTVELVYDPTCMFAITQVIVVPNSTRLSGKSYLS